MNERVRSVLLGLGLGVAPLLLLDLAATLRVAMQRDPTATSAWWPIACYVAAGALVAVGVAAGRRDRLTVAVASLVVVLAALPLVPLGGLRWLSGLPVPGIGDQGGVAGVFLALGAYVYATVRGPRA